MYIIRRTLYHYVTKCMSCHRGIVVITRKVHRVHDFITLILLVSARFEYLVCRESLMTTNMINNDYSALASVVNLSRGFDVCPCTNVAIFPV